jgi:hypothetical protein
MMVNKIQGMGKKPLVILSNCYAVPDKYIPNCIGKRTPVLDSEKVYDNSIIQIQLMCLIGFSG